MKALAWKELREVLGIAALALACYIVLTTGVMGGMVFSWVPGMPDEPEKVPFVSGDFVNTFSLITVVFAGALGFRQSAWESSRGTYLFLLHRPLKREAIFGIKLAMGASVLLVCASVPILIYGCWAATPGYHVGPFEWSMSVPAWRLLFLALLVYLGAFLSGLRPARWFGTRLLPLAASLGLLLMMMLLQSGWVVSLLLSLALGGMLAGSIRFVAWTRDYA